MNKKRLWSGMWVSLGIMLLLLDGKTALDGAQSGLGLCLRTVIPSLLPFFLLSNCLIGILSGEKIPLLEGIAHFLKLPKGGSAMLVPAFLGGYPMGAQAVGSAWKQGRLSEEDACRMLAFCSNPGPAFILGMLSSVFPDPGMVWILWGIQILSAVLVAEIFPGIPGKMCPGRKVEFSFPGAMKTALNAISVVCGWVICFQSMIAVLGKWVFRWLPLPFQIVLAGSLELTSGCIMLPMIISVPLRFILASGLLSLGGICVALQTASVLQGLPIRNYLLGKFLQTVFSLCFALCWAAGCFHLAAAACLFLSVFQKKKSNSGICGANAV